MSKTEKKKNDKERDIEKDIEKDMNEEEESEQTEQAEEIENKAEEAPADPLEAELKKKNEEIEKLRDQLMRNMAEYDNYRKRTSRERIELEPEITAKTASEFLTVADSLERALSAECSDENFKKGVEMIYRSFMETLDKLGVEEIPSEGEFDPALHQAVQQVPADGGQESGTIASTFQKGYRLGDRILRFAMVAVYA
ncbi:MAG: nucleotide exchange factor GrpE [Bacteroides sp.]|nr:nucleotide exchange factor GrpE [Bacteroides sp.]